MKKFLLFLGVVFCVAFSANEASAQIKLGEGQVSVALESNNSYYAKDNVLENLSKDSTEPLSSPLKRIRGDFGSNNYLKVDYNLKGLSVGIQVDAFLPALYGYDLYDYMSKDKTNAAYLSKYIQYEANNWGVRAGDIYDQFGNGLVFRSYEDRALAFNNSLFGARAYYNLNNLLNIKVLAGKPRLYDVRSENWVYGADLSLAISDMIGWNGGIALHLHQQHTAREKKRKSRQETHPQHQHRPAPQSRQPIPGPHPAENRHLLSSLIDQGGKAFHPIAPDAETNRQGIDHFHIPKFQSPPGGGHQEG